jgi:hypothetical protein
MRLLLHLQDAQEYCGLRSSCSSGDARGRQNYFINLSISSVRFCCQLFASGAAVRKEDYAK